MLMRHPMSGTRFKVAQTHLVCTVTGTTGGRSYTHRCTQKVFEEVSTYIGDHQKEEVVAALIAQALRHPASQVNVAIRLLLERGLLEKDRRRYYVPPRYADGFYEHAMKEFHAMTARHDSSPDGTGRGVPIVPVAMDCFAFDSKQDGRGEIGVAPTLRAMNHNASHANAGGQIAVAYPLDLRNLARNSGNQGFGIGPDGAPSTACTARPMTGVAYAFQPRIGRSGRGQPSEIVPTLGGASAGATSDSRPCVAISIKLDNGSSQPIGGVELTPPLCQGGGPSGTSNVAVFTRYAVRRLTPRECERLQGFPDDYTLVLYRGKPAADGPRYKALGNSMAVPVVAWIGRRIAMVDRILAALRTNPAWVFSGGCNEHSGLLELAGAEVFP